MPGEEKPLYNTKRYKDLCAKLLEKEWYLADNMHLDASGKKTAIKYGYYNPFAYAKGLGGIVEFATRVIDKGYDSIVEASLECDGEDILTARDILIMGMLIINNHMAPINRNMFNVLYYLEIAKPSKPGNRASLVDNVIRNISSKCVVDPVLLTLFGYYSGLDSGSRIRASSFARMSLLTFIPENNGYRKPSVNDFSLTAEDMLIEKLNTALEKEFSV